jgi:hypothetical protein
MVLDDLSTWPAEVIQFLTEHHDILLAWEQKRAGQTPEIAASGREYDRAMDELRRLLDPHPLLGFHCTRLTEPEIEHILSAGMQTLDVAVLRHRIQVLHNAGLVDLPIADRLWAENLAQDDIRAGRIRFCFFPPRFAGQSGIERFFRYWR